MSPYLDGRDMNNLFQERKRNETNSCKKPKTCNMEEDSEKQWSQIDWIFAFTPRCAAIISIPCSFFLLYEISCDLRRKKLLNSIQRTIVAMTILDLCAALGWFLSTWALPRGAGPMSAGNRSSCNFQGFLMQVAIGAPLYNCSLAMYFLLIIKYRWTDRKLVIIETWVHIIVLGFSLVSALAMIPLEFYSPAGNVCWIIGDPLDCDGSGLYATGIPCIRGKNAWIFQMTLFYAPMWTCIILCIISLGIVVHEVIRARNRMNAYHVGNVDSQSQGRSQNKINQVRTQAILYSSALLITWLPSTIWTVGRSFNWHHISLDFLSAFCEPLQGMWLFLIFARLRPSTRKKLNYLCLSCFTCCHNSREEGQVDRFIRTSSVLRFRSGENSLEMGASIYFIKFQSYGSYKYFLTHCACTFASRRKPD
jgi:hypothetical protein